ncbi:MAG: OsmC family protein [Crocinitomicaceae bacterium]
MEILLQRIKGMFGFEATNEAGANLRLDAKAAIGGENFGFRPMEALASSLAGCASIDVLLILKKQRIEPVNFEVKIDAKRSDDVPAVFTSIHLDFLLEGSLEKDKVERAVSLSLEKYCSVAKILEPTCVITYSIQLF